MNATALPAPIDQRTLDDTRNDRLFRWLLTAAGLFVLMSLVGVAFSMLWGGREALQEFGLSFFTSTEWDVNGRKFGAVVPIFGTVVTA